MGVSGGSEALSMGSLGGDDGELRSVAVLPRPVFGGRGVCFVTRLNVCSVILQHASAEPGSSLSFVKIFRGHGGDDPPRRTLRLRHAGLRKGRVGGGSLKQFNSIYMKAENLRLLAEPVSLHSMVAPGGAGGLLDVPVHIIWPARFNFHDPCV